MEKLVFTSDDGEKIEFEIIADTRIGGTDYLLVAACGRDNSDEETEAMILKDISPSDSEESSYVIVEDDAEADAVARVFEEDCDIELI